MISKKEITAWVGGIVIGAGVLVVSWDTLKAQRPAPPERVEVILPGQEAFGDSD